MLGKLPQAPPARRPTRAWAARGTGRVATCGALILPDATQEGFALLTQKWQERYLEDRDPLSVPLPTIILLM